MKDIILSGFLSGGAGGGSAGVTSWNDLKDKPFGEETEWVSKFTKNFTSIAQKPGTLGKCAIYGDISSLGNVYGQGYDIVLPQKARLVMENSNVGRLEYEYAFTPNTEGITDSYFGTPVGWYGNISRAIWSGTYTDEGDPLCMLVYANEHYDCLSYNLCWKPANHSADGQTFEFIAQETISLTPIDPKFIPKVAAVSDITSAPTAEQFNALLAALRNAGYMEE